MIRILTVTVFLLCSIYGSVALSQVIEPFTVRVAQVAAAGPGATIEVPVTLETGTATMSRLDITLAYDGRALTLEGVSEGQLCSECDWELFTYDGAPHDPVGLYDRATRVVIIHARAQSRGSDHTPLCYRVDNLPAGLFTLHFRVSDNPAYDGANLPVRFFWYKCEDNRIAVPASYAPVPHNNVVTIGQSVFEPDGWEVTSSDSGLPGYFGPSGLCMIADRNPPVPFINFVNGGVRLRCQDGSVDVRGDINLNGMAGEVEDSWLLAKYFLYGDTVLTNRRLQLHSADLDRDGAPAEIEDLVLLVRMAIGDYVDAALLDCHARDIFPALPDPFASPGPRAGAAIVRVVDQSMAVSSGDSLAAAHLLFDGEVRPLIFDDRLDMSFVYDGSTTRVLVYGFFKGTIFRNGLFLEWEGDGNLRRVTFSTATGGPVNVTIK